MNNRLKLKKFLEKSELVEIVGEDETITATVDGATLDPRGTEKGVEAYFREQVSLLVPEDGIIQRQGNDAYRVFSNDGPVVPSHGYKNATVKRKR